MVSRPVLRFTLLVGVVAAASTMSSSAAHAQSTEPTSTMKACWVEGSGVIYRRDTTGAPTGCQQATHRPIEWTLGLVSTGTGGLTSVPVPLSLSGTFGGPILNLTNSGNGQALIASSSGNSATALFQRDAGTSPTVRMVNRATGDGVGAVLRVEGSGNVNSAYVENTGTAGAIIAQSTSPQQATIFARNNEVNTGSAIYAENRGAWATADFRNIGSANGQALRATSNAVSAPTAALRNESTGGGGALYADSKGGAFTINAVNSGSDGSALGAFSTSSFATANISNTGTGNGRAIWSDSKGNAPTIDARNSGTTGGGAMYTESQGGQPTFIARNTNTTNGLALRAVSLSTIATGAFRNQGNVGGALFAESNGPNFTVNAVNSGTGVVYRGTGVSNFAVADFRNGNANSGSALYLENVSSNNSTLTVEALGGAPAIWTKSSNQNGVVFENTGTGQNISVLGVSNGVWPTAQFENRSGNGPALRTAGDAIISGNLRIEGNYVTTGTKNAAVPTSSGTREMYTEEATEVWFADYGHATLTDSVVWVPFDGTFAETIETDRPYHVFLQAYADASIFVSRRTEKGFEVRVTGTLPTAEPIEFSYRLVAKRRGYGDRRLQVMPTKRVDLPGGGSR